MSRRTFAVLTVGTAMAGGAVQAAEQVTEKDVEVRTPDGVADAVLHHPAGKGPWPAVLLWPDALGLRPVMREMARRLAGQGYVVLTPNPFYRAKKAPIVGADFDFSDPEQRKVIMGFMGALNEQTAATDARAFLAYLDAQPQTNKRAKAGVQGYCMGGPLSFRTAAALPDRIGAVASFHGGGLVTAAPTSPHQLIEKTKAQYLVAIAQNDDKAQPEAKDVLKAAFAKAGRPATVEVYAGDHGWCVPGMPIYNQAEAERAWAALTRLYKTALV